MCSLTVTCEKTLESHMAGRPHNKRVAQLERIKQLEEKVKVDTERALNSLPGGAGPATPSSPDLTETSTAGCATAP